jgi:hypothetical protein
MARRRFSDLERVYDALKLAKVNIDTLPPKLDIRKYADWKEGETTRDTIIRPDLGASVDVGVIAFGLLFADAEAKIQFKLNGRANSFHNGLSAASSFGIEKATFTDYNANPGFNPAKVILKVKGSKVAATSEITGRKYRKNQGASYTVPHGQTTALKSYQGAVNAIMDSALKDTHFMSFVPERFYR